MDLREYSSQARERAESVDAVATVIDRIESVRHWELVTLMVLTGASIIGLYTIMLQLFRPLFGSIGFKLYLTLGYLLAGGLAIGQYLLQMRKFKELGREIRSDELPWLQEAATELAAEIGVDTPEIRLVDEKAPNAFAAGSPSSGIVFFHTGLFDTLSEDEAKAVLAHELAHLKNRDSMILVLAAAVQRLVTRGAWVVGFVFAQVVSAIALMFRSGRDTVWAAQRRAYMRYRIVTITTVFAALIMLLFSRLLSRYREFVADVTAARAIGDPKPMQAALESIHAAAEDSEPSQREGGPTASLYIANGVESKLFSLFDSHPDFGKRIDVLEESFGRDKPKSPTETGAVLGPITKFGLTGAPAIIVGVGVTFGVLLLLELAGVNALSAFDNVFGALLTLVVFLALLASIVTFPWAMLFADGGTGKYGFVAAVLVLVLLFVGSLPDLPLVRHLDILAWLGLIGVAGVQLRAVASELRSA